MNFIEFLTRELRTFQDETIWLSYDVVAEMLTRAAAEALPDELPRILLRREVEPGDMRVWTVLDLHGDRSILDAQDVAVLRALLLIWDETLGPQPGDPLTVPCRLQDGRVVSEVVREMMSDA